MGDIFNIVVIIINGLLQESQSLHEIISKKYFSNYITESFVVYGEENIPIQILKDDKNDIKIRYYIKDSIIKIWFASIMINDDTNEFIEKLCEYYDLKKERSYVDDFEIRYNLIKNNSDSWNISIMIRTSNIYNILNSELLIENNKFEGYDELCLVVSDKF